MARRSRSVVLLALLLFVVLACLALGWRRAIEPVLPPSRASFKPAFIERGAALAAIGNCASCHTAPHGAPFAGGVGLDTSFGRIYSSNVTPDPQTGIGRWSQAAFDRALRDGVARDGSHLYPAFPYDHFTRLTDDDLAALYAYFMTRDAVRATTPANHLTFPFGFRPLVAGWKLLFLHRTPVKPQPAQSAQWNRGAYLVDALAHCSSCHTPRNALGAEHPKKSLNGAVVQGWYAPPLNQNSPSPQPWTQPQLFAYLRTGIAEDHAIAGGPMQEVTESLSKAPEADVQAIATYIVAQMGSPSAERQTRAVASRQRAGQPLSAVAASGNDEQMQLGSSVYAAACASCHDQGRDTSSNSALRLPLAVALYDDDPSSFLRIVREGIKPADGAYGRWMPSFSTSITDEQLTALAAWLRQYAAEEAPWPELAKAVKASRQ